MNFIITALVLCFVCAIITGEVIFNHPCLEQTVITGFEVDKYLGRWYEYARYEQSYEKDSDCVFGELSLNEFNVIRVFNTGLMLPNKTRGPGAIGRAYISYPDEVPLEAKLNVTFGTRPPATSNYWILDTDYDNYSIVYGCRDRRNGTSAQSAWVLSRTRLLDDDVQDKVDENIDKHFQRHFLRITNQDEVTCGYLN